MFCRRRSEQERYLGTWRPKTHVGAHALMGTSRGVCWHAPIEVEVEGADDVYESHIVVIPLGAMSNIPLRIHLCRNR